MTFSFDTAAAQGAIIKVIGVGGGGGNAINRMIDEGVAGVELDVYKRQPRILTLEESLEFLNDDEYMEVTPESIRLRKQILNKAEREKANKKKKSATAE